MVLDSIKSDLRVGVQWDTEVTFNNKKVTQVFCSALPIDYSGIESKYWEPFAQLILDATYEATFYVALANYVKTGNNKLFLTFVGVGAFGNDPRWIYDTIERAIIKFNNTPLDVKIVSYGQSNKYLKEFIERILNV